MIRQSDTGAGQRAREAEPWRRVRALNAYVLGRPDANEVRLIRLILCLILALALGAAMAGWVGVTEMKP